jgi:hypothetical protein
VCVLLGVVGVVVVGVVVVVLVLMVGGGVGGDGVWLLRVIVQVNYTQVQPQPLSRHQVDRPLKAMQLERPVRQQQRRSNSSSAAAAVPLLMIHEPSELPWPAPEWCGEHRYQ